MVVLMVMAMGSMWAYAAFVEPTVAPADYDQDFPQNVMGLIMLITILILLL